jgi:gas vesicle protein
VLTRWSLGGGALGGAVVAAAFLALRPAAAEPLSDAEKIERLEKQSELLQKQLDRQNELIRQLQQAVSRAGKKTEKETEVAKRSQPPVNRKKEETELAKRPEPSVISTEAARHSPPPTNAEILRGNEPAVPITLPQYAGIKFTFWGWLEAATIFRNHNQVNDMLTVFNAIPYPNSPLYNEHEFHGSARQSQFSLLAEGNIDPAQKLTGYLQFDFLAVGLESNYLVTNDWPFRLRHAYITYDNDNWGFHLLAGQEWSMMMPNEVGIVPRKELIPLTINANYLVGYQFTDNWQVRLVKDFDKKVWLGVSLENPATNLAPGIPDTVNGLAINVTNTGTGGFLNGVPVTPSVAPDIIEKVAWDPDWGHVEALAIQRFFVSNTVCVIAAPTGCIVGTTSDKTSFGAGVGGNILVRVIPNYLELMGGVMYGRGIGRYGAGSLPDVTIGPYGSLVPLTAFHAWAGIQVYPWDGLTLYAYGGIEQNNASYFGTFGYGNPGYDNSGCMTPTAESFATGTSATCVADNKRLFDVKAGFWQNLYNGP